MRRGEKEREKEVKRGARELEPICCYLSDVVERERAEATTGFRGKKL